jgi:dienelactone hydrolase
MCLPVLFAQQTIVGHWEGSIKIQAQELIIKVDFKSAGDSLAATIDIPQQNAKALALKNVRYQHPVVHFELPAGPGLAVFDGERKDSAIAGKFTQAGLTGSFAIKLSSGSEIEVAEEPPPKYKPIVGIWSGATDIMGQSLGMSVTFKTKAGELKGLIDIPQQNASGLFLTKVSFESPRVHFELPAGPGLAIWDGEMNNDSINGKFMQAGITGSFHIVRGPLKKVEEPEEIVPYKKEEVAFYDDSIKLAGTLTLPETAGPHPAVVMITGSGPQNRDEELFGMKPFKIIADYFTRNGIAVLRCDDRGVGGSTGKNDQSTTADFAKDALAAVHFLQSRNDINPKQIGLCGHSEGGIVAPLAASQSSDVAFIICIAGTGVTGEEIILAQTELIMRANGATDEGIRNALSLTRRTLDTVRAGGNPEGLRKEIREAADQEYHMLPEEQRKVITNKDEYLDNAVAAQLKAIQTPWFKYFISYDPLPALQKVKCPVLALFGGLDLQVPAELNKNKMEAALKKGGNTDYIFKVFAKANHLFLTAETGNPKEYGTLKKEFAPGFLETMTEWVGKHVTIPK